VSPAGSIEILPVRAAFTVAPRSEPGGTIPWVIETLEGCEFSLHDGDVLVVTSKVISLLEGRTVLLDDVVLSRRARRLGRMLGKDPRKLELILRQGRVQFVLPMHRISRIPGISRLVQRLASNPEAMREGYATTYRHALMVWNHGTYLDNAGIDTANITPGYASQLPENPSGMAREIRHALATKYGISLAVIISDTASSIERYGSRDIAIGYAGLEPVALRLFDKDLYGFARAGGADLTVDSIAGVAGLVMGQRTERTPMMIVRGTGVVRTSSDPEPTMEDIAIPPAARIQATWHTAWATVWYHLASFLTFSRHPKTR
jgi:coenzyme F420-0:L-glutamate ligase/coenzyme F420-1:gamma-L-glutamate ligase